MNKEQPSNIVLPLYGPIKLNNFELYKCKFYVEKRLPKREYHKLVREIALKLNNQGRICTVYDENDIICIKKGIALSEIEDPRIIDIVVKKIPEDKKAESIKQIIISRIHYFYLPKTVFPDKRSFIFDGEEIWSTEKNNITIRLIRHEAIRFSVYISPDCKEFSIMIYPNFKLSLVPSLDKLIDAGIIENDLIGNFIKSTIPGFRSGELKQIKKEGRKYRLHSNEIEKEYKKRNIPVPSNTPLIAVDSYNGRDHWEYSHIYRLQVRFDLFDKLNFLDLKLTKIQEKIEFTAREYVEISRKYQNELQNLLAELGQKSKDPKMIEEFTTESVEFIVNDKKKSSNVFHILKKAGPYDLNQRDFQRAQLIVFCHESDKGKIGNFMKKIRDTLKNLFRLKDVSIRINTFYNLKDILYDKENLKEPVNKETRKIILHYHKKFDELYNSDYNQIKRHFLGKGIPTQGLLARNLNFRSSYINNVAAGIYAKMGGRPWVISGRIAKSLEGPTIYIGFDVSRKKYGKGTHSSPGCVVVYDESGQYVFHFTRQIPITYEFMDEDQAQSLMEEIIYKMKSHRGSFPRNIVFMRDGDIQSSEIIGFHKAIDDINDPKINLYILEFRKIGSIPLIQQLNNQNYNQDINKNQIKFDLANTGKCFSIKNNDKERPFDLFIQTMGNDFQVPSMPKSIKVSLRNIDNIAFDKKDFARQIIALSYLNWAYLKGRTRLPITVHFSHEAALMMEAGINPKDIDMMALWML